MKTRPSPRVIFLFSERQDPGQLLPRVQFSSQLRQPKRKPQTDREVSREITAFAKSGNRLAPRVPVLRAQILSVRAGLA